MNSVFSPLKAWSSVEAIGIIALRLNDRYKFITGPISTIASKVGQLIIKFFSNNPLLAALLAFSTLAVYGKHKCSKLEKKTSEEIAPPTILVTLLATKHDALKATNETPTQKPAEFTENKITLVLDLPKGNTIQIQLVSNSSLRVIEKNGVALHF